MKLARLRRFGIPPVPSTDLASGWPWAPGARALVSDFLLVNGSHGKHVDPCCDTHQPPDPMPSKQSMIDHGYGTSDQEKICFGRRRSLFRSADQGAPDPDPRSCTAPRPIRAAVQTPAISCFANSDPDRVCVATCRRISSLESLSFLCSCTEDFILHSSTSACVYACTCSKCVCVCLRSRARTRMSMP